MASWVSAGRKECLNFVFTVKEGPLTQLRSDEKTPLSVVHWGQEVPACSTKFSKMSEDEPWVNGTMNEYAVKLFTTLKVYITVCC